MRVHSPDPLAAALVERWKARFPGLPGIGVDLVARYGDGTRIYHDLRHLNDILQRIDLLRAEATDPVAVELAVWFHDAVYDIHATDNEANSAALVRALLSPATDRARVDEVCRLVELTTDHAVPRGDANAAVLCDADLGVLASDPDDYDEYVARVRAEYASVPDDAFRKGRAAVLQGLLALPRLFNTEHGSSRWEQPARANLTHELHSIASLE